MKSMVNAVRIGRYYAGSSPTPEAYLVYEAAAGGAMGWNPCAGKKNWYDD